MKLARAVLIPVAVLIVAFPYAWVVLAAFKRPEDLSDPSKLVVSPTLENWREVVEGGVLGSAATSLLVGVSTVTLSLVAGTMAAYAVSRWRAGGSLTRFGILMSEVMPPAALVVPLFLIALRFDLRDTPVAVRRAKVVTGSEYQRVPTSTISTAISPAGAFA